MKISLCERNEGFTLIELLVVISIIGVLATLLLANFNATRARARDAQRKSDLRSIQTALRLYYNDFGYYPEGSGTIEGCGTGGDDECTWGNPFSVEDGNTYMSTLPKDPVSTLSYTYTRTATDTYTLTACFENSSDEKCNQPVSHCMGDETSEGCVYTVTP